MTGEPAPKDVLRPSRLRCIGLGIASTFVAMVFFHVWYAGNETAWIPGLFMVAGAIFFFVHLVPNAYALWLDAEGFNVTEMFTVKRYAWPEVSEFAVRRGILGHYVEFRHAVPDTGENRRVVLNETYGFKPLEMARMLNDWRKRAAAEGEGTERRKVWRSRDC